MKHRIRMSVAAAMILAAGACVSADVVAGLPDATNELLRMYPGSDVIQDQGRVLSVYGVPMTPGMTPQAAADLFLQQHAGAFGAGIPTLQQVSANDLGNGRHTAFAYQQLMDGMPVEHGIARILVLKGPVNRVVYAAGTLATQPEAWPAMTVSPEHAVAMVKGFKQYAKLPVFTTPSLVVYQGEGEWIQPVRAWKFVAEQPLLSVRERWTFFVDASTGSLIHVRNEILSDDLNGTVKGLATPGLNPDITSNPPVLTPLPYMRIGIVGDATTNADVLGVFGFTGLQPGPLQLTATVGPAGGSGRWACVNNDPATPELTVTQSATPGTPANLVFNSPAGGANSMTTAQVNAFIHTTGIHDFYRSRSGDWDNIDVSMRANVNLTQTCNAFFDGSSINFFQMGGGCNNTAYSDVIRHEYGHFVVQSLGLGQGGFGEGFADSGAMLSLDSGPILGRNFNTNGMPVRNVQTANQQYPCNDEVHTCGQILGGVWWGIRVNMGTFYGSAPGLAMTQQLFVDWMLITIGGTGSNFNNSANPTTAIEVLTINDDDGILANGTPDYSRICPVFGAHHINCPPAPPLGFQFPSGLPTLIPSNTVGHILVNVIPMSSTPVDSTGKINYRLNGGTFTEVAMQRLAANQYQANIPAQPCNTNIDYYFKATATAPAGTIVTSPLTAPTDAYYVPEADAILTQFSDDFETDQGWSGAAPEDTATSGRWTRCAPQATAAQPGSDHSPLGTVCWVTDCRAGQQVSDYDVDNGQTTLTSPLFDLAGKLSPRVSFWLWYSNNVGLINPGTNVFVIDVSNDNGISWHRAKTIGPTGTGTTGGWVKQEFAVEPIVAPTATMLVRMIASDYTDSIVEAAVDDFQVTSLSCPPPFCYANCDQSTTPPTLNINDFVCFLNRFAAGDSYANCDHSTTPPALNVLDFNCFLNAFAGGCS